MDGTENLNGLAKPSRNVWSILQACVENEKPTMETETIQRNFGNRQKTDKQQTKIQSTRHKTGRPNCERPDNGNLH